MATLKQLTARGYTLRESLWDNERRDWTRIYSKHEDLSGKPWQGAYGPEIRGIIHRAVVYQGKVISLASWRAIHNLQDGSWWYCANVPPVLS